MAGCGNGGAARDTSGGLLLLLDLLLLMFFLRNFNWIKHSRLNHLIADPVKGFLNIHQKFMQALLQDIRDREGLKVG
jgi:hypothetical protein